MVKCLGLEHTVDRLRDPIQKPVKRVTFSSLEKYLTEYIHCVKKMQISFVLNFPIIFKLLHADGIAIWNCVRGISSSSYPLAKIITHVPDQMGL